MSKLWTLMFFSLIIAFLSEYHDEKLKPKIGRRDRFFTLLLILLLGTFCGLRVWYNDTVTYLQIFDRAGTVSEFLKNGKFDLAHGWGFELLTCTIKMLGFSSQDYLMLFAFLTIVPYIIFIKRYCPDFVFGVFLMFTTGFYTFTLAAIKQCMATGICLLAVMAALDKKWLRYLFCIGLAVLFHPYSIVYLLIPFLMFQPWTARTYMLIVIFGTVGFELENLFGTIVDVTTVLGANYDASTFIGEGVNIFRVMVSFVPLVLSIPYKFTLFRDSDKADNLFFNLTMIHALIMFIGLFGTANYFARLANYFLPATIIVLPWMLNKLNYRDRLILKSTCLICYLAYFHYENAIKQNFDTHLSQVGLWEYIASHF